VVGTASHSCGLEDVTRTQTYRRRQEAGPPACVHGVHGLLPGQAERTWEGAQHGIGLFPGLSQRSGQEREFGVRRKRAIPGRMTSYSLNLLHLSFFIFKIGRTMPGLADCHREGPNVGVSLGPCLPPGNSPPRLPDPGGIGAMRKQCLGFNQRWKAQT
jgi:hypothetical protein